MSYKATFLKSQGILMALEDGEDWNGNIPEAQDDGEQAYIYFNYRDVGIDALEQEAKVLYGMYIVDLWNLTHV